MDTRTQMTLFDGDEEMARKYTKREPRESLIEKELSVFRSRGITLTPAAEEARYYGSPGRGKNAIPYFGVQAYLRLVRKIGMGRHLVQVQGKWFVTPEGAKYTREFMFKWEKENPGRAYYV